MSVEFEELRAAEEADAPTVLDTYGAENPSEFFAVATETFFERPRALKEKHPELYGELQRFFRQDPAAYSSEQAG
jgi:Mlc titration factor MtfA (ptsG expression regulator)